MSEKARSYPRWKHHATKPSLIVHNETEDRRHEKDGYAEHRGGLHSPKLTHEPEAQAQEEKAPETDLGGSTEPEFTTEFDGKSEDELREILMGTYGIPAKKLKGKTHAELVEMIKEG